jgi:phosphoenolpyruvate carboxykinase (ATP)
VTMVSKDVCVDDSVPSVRVSTLQELHSLQKKRSAPSTPKDLSSPSGDLLRQRQQLQSIR